jgi:hypothetical protein
MSVVVGLTGRKQAGKDTVAIHLIQQYGFQRFAFADAIREMVHTLNPIIVVGENGHGTAAGLKVSDFLEVGWTPEQLKKAFPIYREFLQKLGTECVRKYSEDFWVNIVLDQMTDDNARYVITDTRFPNEAELLKTRRFRGDDVYLWHIQNDVAESVPAEHDSERWAGKLNEDHILHNNGSIAELYADLDEMAVDLAWVTALPAAA